MARSLKERLDEINRREQKCRAALAEVVEEKKKLIVPTKGKISGIMLRGLEEFLEENMEQALGAKIDPDRLSAAFKEMLLRELISQKEESFGEEENKNPKIQDI